MRWSKEFGPQPEPKKLKIQFSLKWLLIAGCIAGLIFAYERDKGARREVTYEGIMDIESDFESVVMPAMTGNSELPHYVQARKKKSKEDVGFCVVFTVVGNGYTTTEEIRSTIHDEFDMLERQYPEIDFGERSIWTKGERKE